MDKRKKAKGRIYVNRYAKRVLTEKELRIRISLYGGLLFNIGFAIFKVVMGTLLQSKWLFAMAGYNIVLSVMRFVLVYRDQTNRREETEEVRMVRGLHSYRVCGWLMLLLNIAISVIVAIVVFDEQKIVYPGYMIYAIAAFTFYCLTMSIISIVKYWNRRNPVFSAVKRIGFAKALVSVFTMQVAMLTQFGEAGLSHRLANAATGGAVCVIVTVTAVFMLREPNKRQGESREMENKNNEVFEYTYSAEQQQEIEQIRKKYIPKEEDKMDLLRKLDRDASKAGTRAAIAIGVVGCLLFGVGMCCTMVWADSLFGLGIVVGILGMIVMGMAYPQYKKITEKQRRKIAPQILALTEELSK